MAIPSFDEWSGQARAKFPTASEDAIKQAYTLKFNGADAVRTQGPSPDAFAQAAREKFPAATDEAIGKAYELKYGASTGTSIARGVKTGFAQAGKLTGALLGGLGADETGEGMFNYWQGVADRNQPARALQGNVVDQPSLLAKPAYWGSALGGVAGNIVNPIGYALAGAQHGADVYGRTGSVLKGLGVGAAETALNVLPFGGSLGRLGRGALFGSAGAVQPAIEAAATGDSIPDALKEGAGAFPLGFAMGAALPSGARGAAAGDRAAFEARLNTLGPERVEAMTDQGIPSADQMAAATEAMRTTPLGGPRALPPPAVAPDFVGDAAGNVGRPGETAPTPLALPPPVQDGFAVDAQGNVMPRTQAQAEAAAAMAGERQQLGMGEADAIQARMQQQRDAAPQFPALPPPQVGGFAVDPLGGVMPRSQAEMARLNPQRAEAAALGLGEADAIQARMAAARARQPVAESAPQSAPPTTPPIAFNDASQLRPESGFGEQPGAPSTIGSRPPVPSLDEFTAAAKAKFSNASDENIAAAYRMKYPSAGAPIERDPFRAPATVDERWLADKTLRADLTAMKGETGWYQEGGKMIRIPRFEGGRGNEDIISRTSWIPNADWWPGRPKGLTEAQTHQAIDVALAGGQLSKRQRAIVAYMTDVADERRKNVGNLPMPDEFRETDLAPTVDHANEAALVSRATDIDEAQVERLARIHEDDHHGFLAAIKKLVDQNDQGAGPDAGRAPDSDPQATGSGSSSVRERPGAYGADRSALQGQEPAVEARRRAYSAQGVGSEHGQLPLDFETRPDTRAQQTRLGRAALYDLLPFRDRGTEATVLGHGLTRDFAEHGTVSLVGRTVGSEHDLAQLAQVYRDPRFETLRFFLTRGDEVVSHYGVTSRLPGAVQFKDDGFAADLARNLKAVKADGYHILHNHPAGFADPSFPDINFTQRVAKEVPGFKSHVVIDHNEYGVIRMSDAGDGIARVHRKDFGGYDPMANPIKPHDLLFERIRRPEELVRVGKKLEAREGFSTLIAVDSRNRVRALAEYPSQSLSRGGKLYVEGVARIRRLQLMSGAGGYVFAITKDPKALQPLLDKGIIADAYRPGDTDTRGSREGINANALDARARSYPVQETQARYDTMGKQSAPGSQQGTTAPEAPRAERVDVGGGSYSMKQFARLTDSESAVLTGVMRELEQPIKSQRRGTRTWDATEQRALQLIQQKYGITLDGLVNRKPGSTANAEQLEAYATILSGASKALTDAAAEVARTNSHESIAKLAVLREKLGLMLAPAMGYRTEAGRALNILAKTAGDFRRADKLFEALGDGTADSLRDFAKKLSETSNPDQVIGVTRESYTPDWLDKLLEYRISMGLLSGPATHSVNIASNAMFNALELGSHALAATFSKSLPFESVRARIAATVHGATVGLTNAKRAFMTEEGQITPRDKFETRQRAIGGKLGKVVRIPTRALMAEDELFKSVAFHQQLADLAMREAVAKNPRDVQGEFSRIMGDVLNRTDLVDAAHTAAERLTFQDPLGPYMGMLSAASSKGGGRLVRLIIPFIRTPTNILKRAVEYTPAGYTMKAVREGLSRGGADAALAHSRVAIGSGIMLGVLGLASKGLLSGAGPEDKAERDLWMREGHQPYSVKVGDKWVRYNRFDPFGTIMGVAADMYEIGHAASNDQLDKVGSMLMTSVALNLGDKSFLQGITDFANAYSDPKRYMERWASGLATSFIPNVAAQYARESDPYQREARNLIDQARAKIPGMREDLAKRLDIAGQPQANAGTGFGSPLQASTERADPVASAMLELGVFKSKPSRNFSLQKRAVTLNDEEYEGYSGFVQQARWAQLTPMVNSPQFRQLMQQSPIRAQDMLKRAYEKIGDDAHMAFLYRNPDLVGRILSTRPSERIMPSDFAATR